MQVGGDIKEALVANVDRIDIDLEKTILMIGRQEDVVPPFMLEQENTNEDVELHAQIQMERMGGVFILLQHLC
jgi:hypothetical protein